VQNKTNMTVKNELFTGVLFKYTAKIIGLRHSGNISFQQQPDLL